MELMSMYFFLSHDKLWILKYPSEEGEVLKHLVEDCDPSQRELMRHFEIVSQQDRLDGPGKDEHLQYDL